MRKRFFIALPYRKEVHCCAMSELNAYKRKYLGDPELYIKGASAATFPIAGAFDTSCFLVVLPDKYNEEDAWHEALHASTYVLQAHGVTCNAKEDETLAYLQAYIKRTCCAMLYGKKKAKGIR